MLSILRIEGDSLSPNYKNGDFVVIHRIPLFLRYIKSGDIIAFKQKKHGVLIKQVLSVNKDDKTVFVIGSHPESTDSNSFGAIQFRDIIGKKIFHFRKPKN